MLLAAAHETALLSQLEEALPMKQPLSCVSRFSPHQLFPPQRSLLLTFLFLPAVGLHRFWDLRGYTGREMARLSGRAYPYSYRHTERFLLRLSHLDGDQVLTEALARWATSLWHAEDATLEPSSSPFYLDGLSLPVYTRTLIPPGLIGNSGKILGCRALVLLHDAQGHPLRASTHRGDLHLTNLVADREAVVAEFLAQLKTQGRTPLHHPQDQSIRRTRLVQPCRSVRAADGESTGEGVARGRSCSVCFSSS